jgi:hypothetical protein
MALPTKKSKVGRTKCPLSPIKGEGGKYLRKVMVGGKCVNPTSANQKAARADQMKADKLRQNKARGAEATAKAAEKSREDARKRGAKI